MWQVHLTQKGLQDSKHPWELLKAQPVCIKCAGFSVPGGAPASRKSKLKWKRTTVLNQTDLGSTPDSDTSFSHSTSIHQAGPWPQQ